MNGLTVSAMDVEDTFLHRRHTSKTNNESTKAINEAEEDPLLSLDDNNLDVKQDELEDDDMYIIDQADKVVRKIIQVWDVCHFNVLPEWLQDNDFLTHGHRPPLPSFRACFKSIFRIHTETGNIWTHMIGCLAFICLAAYYLIDTTLDIQLQEKVVFGIFFVGIILCLGFSFTFHTVSCHSPLVSKIFSKLDYCGISIQIMGSSVLWLYYGFYCHFRPKMIYLTAVCILGCVTIILSFLDKFSEPSWRAIRAITFITFGLSSIVPAIHYGFLEGWFNNVSQKSLGWLLLMGILYIAGATLYAVRVPERFFPGKFDLWLHSHQIFHVFVICAALAHLRGVSELAIHRVTADECSFNL